MIEVDESVQALARSVQRPLKLPGVATLVRQLAPRLVPRPSTIEAFRAAQQQALAEGSGASLEPRGPVPPTPTVTESVTTANLDAAAWLATVTAMMTTVATAATIKGIAEKNPAYARIVQKATQTVVESTATVAEIASSGAAIEAAFGA